MTAYELADELDGRLDHKAANMLRQQADRIVLLEAYLKSEEKRIAELEKDLHMIQRHYDQLDTKLHQQTKPLSEDEIEIIIEALLMIGFSDSFINYHLKEKALAILRKAQEK